MGTQQDRLGAQQDRLADMYNKIDRFTHNLYGYIMRGLLVGGSEVQQQGWCASPLRGEVVSSVVMHLSLWSDGDGAW